MKRLTIIIILIVISLYSSAQKMVYIDTTYQSYTHYIDTIYDVQYYVSVMKMTELSDTTTESMPMTTYCRHDKLIHLYGKNYSRWYWYYQHADHRNPDEYYTWQIYLIGYKQYGKPFIVVKTY